MNRLLTIAIPTYNRASLLDRQLSWFAEAVKGHEDQCELLVTDNCSTDDTPRVLEKWQQRFQDRRVPFRINRNPENIGAIRNIAYCINQAQGEFVWTVSDDDAVEPGAVPFVLDTAQAHRDLHLLILNFSSRHWRTRKLRYARCFEVEDDQILPCGKDLFESYLSDPNPSRWGGLALTTVLVYRSVTARQSLQEWPEGLDNLTCQLYVTAYCARQGKTILTRDPYVEMAGGRAFFSKDRVMYFRFKLAEVPEAFLRLAALGYSRDLCEQKILNQREELKWRLLCQNLSRSPLGTFRVLRRYNEAIRRIRSYRPEGIAPVPVEDKGAA